MTALIVFYLGAQVGILVGLVLAARRQDPLPEGSSVGFLMLGLLGGLSALAVWGLVR